MNMKNRNVTYSTVGDYQLPNLTLNQPQKPLGRYGRMRRIYLMEHRPVLYNSMLLTGRLWAHLTEIDRTAQEQMDSLVAEMAQEQGVTEALKAANQLDWVRRMNSIRNRAEEIIKTELIFV